MKRSLPAPLSVWRPLNLDDFLIGVPHYPEHVDENYWRRDAERIAAAGFNTVRMGEFAWHIFEPAESSFSFEFFDRAITILGQAGIRTVLCTPAATPPRWLTANYPEVLRVDANGRQAGHGSRQHADTASPVFRMNSRRITRALAEHYRDNPLVIGWQTDNELNTTVSESYSNATLIEFQKFLREKYGSIEALNFAWGGHFWATAYEHFDQVVLPRNMAPSFLSPGHVQDYHRFLAIASAAFQHDQVEILRAANPDWFIFHNLGNLADIDFRGQFGQDLDFIGFDIYPMLYDEMRRTGGHAATQAMHLDMCRACAGNFIVPEQASDLGSQPGFSTNTPEPGEMRRMAMTSVARGADGLMFFRWRPAHFGAEIYWMGLIDHDDAPRRHYAEAAQFAADIAKIKSYLLGTVVRMDVGIAGADFDNQEAYKTYPMGLPSPQDDAILLHRHCYTKGIAFGYIHPEGDLNRLKLLYVPHWMMWKPEWDARVEAFVRGGGTLVVSAMTGTRDENNHVIRELAPGAGLTVLCGVRAQEFGRVAPAGASGLLQPRAAGAGAFVPHDPPPANSAARRYHFTLGNHTFEASHLYERLELDEGVETLGAWSDRFLAGEPSITSRKVGAGRVVYVGTYLTPELAEGLSDALFADAGVAPLLSDLPEGVEATERRSADHRLLFILNTLDRPTALRGLPAGRDLLTGGDMSGSSELEAFGCSVILLT